MAKRRDPSGGERKRGKGIAQRLQSVMAESALSTVDGRVYLYHFANVHDLAAET
ncbi:hypothetical protein KIPB_014840, partial [Kipferlia bialata]|eukprot:g14840.t1